MIHYRLQDKAAGFYATKTFRSLAMARATAKRDGGLVVAFASRPAALALLNPLVICSSDPTPRAIDRELIDAWLNSHDSAKAINPKYPPSSARDRRRMEATYDWHILGFDRLGRAVSALQCMSVSCNWVRYKAPIMINGRKSNVLGLKKAR